QIPGSIPAFYREVYEKVCSPTSGNVKLEVFRSLLVKSQLSGSIINQVRLFSVSFIYLFMELDICFMKKSARLCDTQKCHITSRRHSSCPSLVHCANNTIKIALRRAAPKCREQNSNSFNCRLSKDI
ncbi:hypothetical protein ALC60_04639, partial [Trachymyrmex zeteki]